ncbi:hypothetical protein [Pseudomonas proteolytica]|uniref:hypothetical protein n=1 Tax=Pseudomonas proteolytica TaxID=219574 RepID=UPI0030D77619
MDDLALLHRGDLESARLSRDHADALRRSSEVLRPITVALRVADGRAYDPSGIIPQLRTALDEWIGRHEEGARDMDARATAYEANAASRVSAVKTLTLAEMVRQLAHNVLVCAGAAALALMAYHTIEKWRGHLGDNAVAVSAERGHLDGNR